MDQKTDDTIMRAGRAWDGTEGAKRWQITQRGWGEGWRLAGHGHKDDISAKSGNLGREGLWGGTGGAKLLNCSDLMSNIQCYGM